MLGVGLTWGASWAAIGAVVGAIIGIVSPSSWTLANPIAEWAIGIGMYGFVSGLGFAGLLSLREARKRIGELSLGRVALWGLLGAAAVPPIFGLLGTFEAGTTLVDVLQAIGLTAFLGSTFASSSVAIARRAELEGAREVAALGTGGPMGKYRVG